MTEPADRDSAYLEHMLEAIARIQRYVGRKGRAAFLASPLLQDAVIRNIEVIGEAAARVRPDYAAQHASIPWRDIVGMRHRLIHGYLKINLDTVWQAVRRDLPLLEHNLRAILQVRGSARAPAARKRPKRARRARR